MSIVGRVVGRVVCVVALLSVTASPARADGPELWLYCSQNLLPDANIDKLDALFARAQRAGYTHVLLADSKFAVLGHLGSNEVPYRRNLARVKASADKHGLRLVPALFPIGYSNSLLARDPNLAEGLPVVDTPMVVRDGKLEVDRAAGPVLGKPVWQDPAVDLDASGVATVDSPTGNARLVFKLNLPAYRCYHVSVMVRTQDFSGRPEVKPLAGNTLLDYAPLGVKRTQDWTRHDLVFDTLDHTDINLYFGTWGAAKGQLQWKDWTIEEAGLVNVLRRPGTPVTVRTEQGAALVEGQDVGRVVDPQLGTRPWPGEYTAWHEPPAVTSRLPEGTRLRVSWYYPPITEAGAVGICPNEPATNAALADQFRQMDAAFGSRGYMMSHDEIRCWNQCKACTDRHLDAGAMLAENARQCAALLKGKDAYAWSDMFDPTHNAHGGYYLAKGNFAGASAGLAAGVTILNWNFGRRDASLDFFAKAGHRQIVAGYYDGPPSNVAAWRASVDHAAPAVRASVIGYMYTTWQNRYDDLEAFAKVCGAGER